MNKSKYRISSMSNENVSNTFAPFSRNDAAADSAIFFKIIIKLFKISDHEKCNNY